VAAVPPGAIIGVLSALPRPDGPGVRWEPAERWHVTLRFVGSADPEAVAAALHGVALPRATAVLGPRVQRLGAGVVVAPVGGLDALAGAVLDATTSIGRPPDPRPFSGHLTLARLRQGAECPLVGVEVRGTFQVGEVAIVDSRSTAAGPRYVVVDRVPTEP
jgi:2'-5' RNA ligase